MTFPAILSEVLPERLSPGRSLFIPLSRDVVRVEKRMNAVNAEYPLGVWPPQYLGMDSLRNFIVECFTLGQVPPDGPSEIVNALELPM